MQRVLVIDNKKQPLMPCPPARARRLLSQGKAIVTKGKKQGAYAGRIAVRAIGYFNITTTAGTVQGIGYQHCRLQQNNDDYHYSNLNNPITYQKTTNASFPPRTEVRGGNDASSKRTKI